MDPVNAWRRQAAKQHGVITAHQLLDAGLSRRQIASRTQSGELARRHRGVYVVAGTPDTWLRQLSAARLAVGEDAAASGPSAAAVWEIDGFDDVPIEISTVRRSRPFDGLTIRHVKSLEASDICLKNGIKVTTPARTLIDLAPRVEEEVLEIGLECFLRRRLLSLDRLRRRLDASGPRNGVGRLRRLLDARGDCPAAESALEVRVIRLMRKARLPDPVRQFSIVEQGAFVARVDLAYPHARIAIEVQSYGHHGMRRGWEKDQRRINHFARNEWTLVTATDQMLNEDRPAFLEDVTILLDRAAPRLFNEYDL